jgi:hypothetical protein
MKRGEKMLVCALAALFLCAAARAAANPSGSPYQGIVERNVFGLKPPPPPPDPEANKPPPPKITLQGFTTFGGIKRALLKAQLPAKPGEPPKGEQGFVLAEGQRDGDIEVLEINTEARTVKVNDFGTITNLNFENNGIKTAGAAPVAGAAPRPGVGFPPPAANPNPFTPTGGAQPLPITRPTRLPLPNGAAATPTSGGATPVYATGTPGYAGGVSLPGFGTASPTASQPEQNTGPTFSREEQAIILAAQKQHYQSMGSPLANLIPPPPPDLAPPAATENGSGPSTPKPWTPPRAPGLPPLPQ